MTIEQWIETYKPTSYHKDTREFITNHLRGLYDVHTWTIVPKDNTNVLVPSKRLASGIMFLICKEMWEDSDLEFCFTDKEIIEMTDYIDNLNR